MFAWETSAGAHPARGCSGRSSGMPGWSTSFFIDSAGTTAYHVGERADPRMRKHAARRGVKLTSRARQLRPSDLSDFDYILAMDRDNYRGIMAMAGASSEKVFMMTDFAPEGRGRDVPDPYYGGPGGFELVLDLLEDSCRGLLSELREKHGL